MEESPSDYESLLDKDMPPYTIRPAERLTLTYVANAPVPLWTTPGDARGTAADSPPMVYPVRFTFSLGEGMGSLVWTGDGRPAVGVSIHVEWNLPDLVWNGDCRPAPSDEPRIWVEAGRVHLIALVESVQTENDTQVAMVLRLGGEMLPSFLSGARPQPGDWLEIELETLELWPE